MDNVLGQTVSNECIATSASLTDALEPAQQVSEMSKRDWLRGPCYHQEELPVEDRIKSAFLDVLVRTPFHKIRMAEVAKMSGTSRQNIYRYFSSKEEIFRAAVDDLFDEFYEKATPFLQDTETDFSYFFIFLVYSEIQKYHDVFTSMLKSGADDILRQQMRRYYRRFVGKIVRESKVEVKSVDMLDYIGDIAVGSTFELLKRWVGNGMKESPQQMARMHSHFFNGKLSDLLNVNEVLEAKG